MTAKTQSQSKLMTIWKAFVRLQNPMMTWLLQSPLHFFVSKHYMLITFRGRKSGKSYTTPVQYKWTDDRELFVITSKKYIWWKNLKDGAEVTLMIKRQALTASAGVSSSIPIIRESIETMYPSLSPKQKDEFVDNSVIVVLNIQ